MSFVHNDQENRIGLRNFKGNSKVNVLSTKIESQQQKRSVLGLLNANNVPRNVIKPKIKPQAKAAVSKLQVPKTNACSFAVHVDKVVPKLADAKSKPKRETSPAKGYDKLEPLLELPARIANNRLLLKDAIVDDALQEPIGYASLAIEKAISPVTKSTGLVLKKIFDIETYSRDIMLYLKSIEGENMVRPAYMSKQPDVTESMRTILVDWLVEVAEEYKLHTETLFLAVSMIDRFLSIMSVVRAKLQLLGTAAMYVASKYEEIYPPDVSEFVYITDDTYTKRQVLRMEQMILKVLKFSISSPTAVTFLTLFAVRCRLADKVQYLAMYLCELVLLEGDPYHLFPSSLIACSSIALARYCLDVRDIWPEFSARETGYQLSQLSKCIDCLNATHAKASTLQQQAITIKYNSNRYMNVASVKPKELDAKEYVLQMKELCNVGDEDK